MIFHISDTMKRLLCFLILFSIVGCSDIKQEQTDNLSALPFKKVVFHPKQEIFKAVSSSDLIETLSFDDADMLMEQAEKLYKQAQAISVRANAAKQTQILESMRYVSEQYMEISGKMVQLQQGSLKPEEQLLLFDDLQEFNRNVRNNLTLNQLSYAGVDARDTAKIQNINQSITSFQESIQALKESNLSPSAAQIDELITESKNINDSYTAIMKQFAVDIDDSFSQGIKTMTKNYEKITQALSEQRAKDAIDPKLYDEFIEFGNNVHQSLNEMIQYGAIGGQTAFENNIRSFEKTLQGFDSTLFKLTQLQTTKLFSTVDLFKLAKKNKLLKNANSIGEIVTSILNDPDTFQDIIKQITGPQYAKLEGNFSTENLNNILKRTLYVPADKMDDLAYHTFSSVAYSNKGVGPNLRPLLVGEIPVENKFALRVVKRIKKNKDGSANYLVKVVTRENNTNNVIDQYILKQIEDSFDLTNKVIPARLSSSTTARTSLMSTDNLLSQLKNANRTEAENAIKILELYGENPNMYLADVLNTELSKLNKSGAFSDIADLKTFITDYDTAIKSLKQNKKLLAKEIDTLLKNKQLKDFQARYKTTDSTGKAKLLDDLKNNNPELSDLQRKLNGLEIDSGLIPDADNLTYRNASFNDAVQPNIFNATDNIDDVSRFGDDLVDVTRYTDNAFTSNKTIAKAMAVDLALEAVVSSYGIYLLDQSYYARSYAERNNLSAQTTQILIESAASVAVTAALYAAGATSGFWPVAIPMMIFIGTGVTTSILLDKRYEKMTQAQEVHLFLHQLYDKYRRQYARPTDLYTVNTFTGSNVLSFVKDGDIVIKHIDMSKNSLVLEHQGALFLERQDQSNQGTSEFLNVYDIWKDKSVYPQIDVPKDNVLDMQAPLSTMDIDAIILPSQAAFHEPWERKVISTKKGGVYAKNYQLGASLALSLEKQLYTKFKPWFFMQENRHIVRVDHSKRQFKNTEVVVSLPESSIDIIVPVTEWGLDSMNFLTYRLKAAAAAGNYYSITSSFFDVDETPKKSVHFVLEQGMPDTIWDVNLFSLDFESDATIAYEGSIVTIADTQQRSMSFDVSNISGHLFINGFVEGEATLQYIYVQQGKIVANPSSNEILNELQVRKNMHIQGIQEKQREMIELDDESFVLQNAQPPSKKTTMYISNATWEQGTATVTFDDSSTQELAISKENTLQANLNQGVKNIQQIEFKTTKSVKYKKNPTRIIDQSTIQDHMSENMTMLCFQMNQGTMRRDFRVTPELCDINTPRYFSGNESIAMMLSKDKKQVFKIKHPNLENPIQPLLYNKVSLDNQSRENVYITIRYRYIGQEYRLAIQEEMLPWKKITCCDKTNGSRADFYIPDGATILSLKAQYATKSELFDMFQERQSEFINQPFNEDLYIDLEKGLLVHGVAKTIDPTEREQRYIRSYERNKQFYENLARMGSYPMF